MLLSPWLSRLQGGQTSVGGFVRGSDFQTGLERPFSNRCDMMYVNSGTLPGPHLRTLLIHEYTHAVCFSRRAGDGGSNWFPDEEDWLNEAIAHCAETFFGGGWSNLDYRISRFLNDTSAFPLVVDDYYRAGLWRCHGCRGATYLFLRYCVERFGTQTLTRLIANPARGTRNIACATGCPFDRLFRDWTLSLLQNGSRSARHSDADLQQSPPGLTAQPELAPLDLHGPLGNWGLAGPRHRTWNVDAGPLALEIKGSAAAYVDLFASAAAGRRRIRIHGPKGARLQLSLIREPDDAPRMNVSAKWVCRARRTLSGQSSGDPALGDRFLEAVVRVMRSAELEIEQISLEQNEGECHVSRCISGDALRGLGTTSIAGGAAVLGLNTGAGIAYPGTSAVFNLPAQPLAVADVPVIVKVVAVDKSGRRFSGSATVGSRPAIALPERLAQGRP